MADNLTRRPKRVSEISTFIGGLFTAIIISIAFMMFIGYTIPQINRLIDILTILVVFLIVWSLTSQYYLAKYGQEREIQEISSEIEYQKERLGRIKHTLEYFQEDHKIGNEYINEVEQITYSKRKAKWEITKAESIINNYHGDQQEKKGEIPLEEKRDYLNRIKRRTDAANEALEDYMSVVKYYME